jgi:multiple antibiotic resistance protein
LVVVFSSSISVLFLLLLPSTHRDWLNEGKSRNTDARVQFLQLHHHNLCLDESARCATDLHQLHRAGVTGCAASCGVFVALTVLALLLVFLFVGSDLLSFLGVSIDAFRIAGAGWILLLLMGLKIVAGEEGGSDLQLTGAGAGVTELKEAETIFQKIVIPMAMPLLVGPGVIANVILYASKEGDGVDRGGLVVGAFLLALVVLAIFLAGRWLKAVIGPIGLDILMRVMGLMVAAMGVQFMVTGVSQIVVTQLAPALR